MRKTWDVLIVGAGPAGIFTALELTRHSPKTSILLIDKGRSLSQRNCPQREDGSCAACDPCNITFGWSGAGGFSDGKLSLTPRVGGRLTEYFPQKKVQELIDYADDIYLKFGAPREVHGLASEKVERLRREAARNALKLIPCPIRHLGTEKTYQVFQKLFEHLMKQGNCEFRPRTVARRVIVEDGKVQGVKAENRGQEYELRAGRVVLAPGRGGAAWLTEECGRLGIPTTSNEVDIGVRVEVQNAIVENLTGVLYEAKLVYYSDTFENRVRSFCMNPGGVVSEEHYDDGVAVVNGHSYGEAGRKTENTNFALLVSTSFTQPFNQPLEYGKYIAHLANMLTGGGIMVQRLGDLLQGRRSNCRRMRRSLTQPTMKSAVPGDLSYVLPQRYLTSITETLKAFEGICPGIYARDTLLYGVEVKFYSSKVGIEEDFETRISNLYTIGDGAGITRGLMQASVSGVIVARRIAGIW